jgi:hypothetical protein
MDVVALQTEAVAAIDAATSLDELEDLRVRYLGRKRSVIARAA